MGGSRGSPCMQMCSLRLQFVDLFHDLPLAHKITVDQTGAFYFSQACSEDVFNFFQRQTNDSYPFKSELMNVFCMPYSQWLVFTRNLNSQTTWLKVKFKLVTSLVTSYPCNPTFQLEAASTNWPACTGLRIWCSPFLRVNKPEGMRTLRFHKCT